MSTALSDLTAAQLSNAAYPNNSTPAGWTKASTITTTDGNNSFSIFTNSSTQQVVIAFKGSDNLSNFQSDLSNSGSSEWAAIKPLAESALKQIQDNPTYSGYSIIADGHSLGGGMAQTFALEKGLSGYGQNSLPISQGAIDVDITAYGGTITSAIAAWSAAGNKFHETNTSGDPATLYYSSLQDQVYLPGTTTTISSPYAGLEVLGVLLTATPFATVGAAIVADAAYKAHSLPNLIGILGGSTITGDTSFVDTSLVSNRSAILGDFSKTSLKLDASGNAVATANNGTTVSISSYTATANSDTYSLFVEPNLNTAIIGTGSGIAISQSGAIVGVVGGISATLSGASNTVSIGDGSSVQIAGSGNGLTIGSNVSLSVTGSADNLTTLGHNKLVTIPPSHSGGGMRASATRPEGGRCPIGKPNRPSTGQRNSSVLGRTHRLIMFDRVACPTAFSAAHP